MLASIVKKGLKASGLAKGAWFDDDGGGGAAVNDELLLEGVVDVDTLPRADLQENLRARGLKDTGRKTELVARMKLYIQSKREASLHYMASDDARRREEITLEESGSVYACGANHQGQLGTGDKVPHELFTVLPGLRGKSTDLVVCGSDYCVAVTEDSEVYTWGGGGFAPLGHPKPVPPEDDDEMEEYLAAQRERLELEGEAHLTPRFLEALRGEGIVEASAGTGHVLAVSDAGDLWSWGGGLHGQLGHGGLVNLEEPKMIEIMQERVVVAVAAGHSHSMALSDEETPYAWGFTHGGRLGLGVLEREDPNPRMRKYFPMPTLMPFFRPPKQVLQVACSANHSVALVRDANQVYTWGTGDGGRLGHGDKVDKALPTPVEAFKGTHVLQVSCGPWHSAAIQVWPPMIDCGVVYTWGSGHFGQLGQGPSVQSLAPQPVISLLKQSVSVKHIECGTHHNAAISHDNVLYTWGSNKYGCLGAELEDEYTPEPTRVWAFDVMINGVGRGSPRSVACGHDFTVVACFPYIGPSEEELIELEQEALHDVQKTAIKEAEKEIKRLVVEEQKEDEDRKRAGLHFLEAQPLCDLCQVCPGFTPNLFKPSVCKECSHLKIKHNRAHVADEDLLSPGSW